jgi:hypothetical protein
MDLPSQARAMRWRWAPCCENALPLRREAETPRTLVSVRVLRCSGIVKMFRNLPFRAGQANVLA